MVRKMFLSRDCTCATTGTIFLKTWYSRRPLTALIFRGDTCCGIRGRAQQIVPRRKLIANNSLRDRKQKRQRLPISRAGTSVIFVEKWAKRIPSRQAQEMVSKNLGKLEVCGRRIASSTPYPRTIGCGEGFYSPGGGSERYVDGSAWRDAGG